MGDLFFKALKWFFFITCIIGGIACIKAVEDQGVQPTIFVILCFGAAYLLSRSWRDLPAKAMVISILAVAAIAAIAYHAPKYLYIYLGLEIPGTFYIHWAGLTFFAGIPFMMYIFNRYDK